MLEDKEFDPTEVSKYARHARMDTTMGYYHPNKKAIYDKLAKGQKKPTPKETNTPNLINTVEPNKEE